MVDMCPVCVYPEDDGLHFMISTFFLDYGPFQCRHPFFLHRRFNPTPKLPNEIWQHTSEIKTVFGTNTTSF